MTCIKIKRIYKITLPRNIYHHAPLHPIIKIQPHGRRLTVAHANPFRFNAVLRNNVFIKTTINIILYFKYRVFFDFVTLSHFLFHSPALSPIRFELIKYTEVNTSEQRAAELNEKKMNP